MERCLPILVGIRKRKPLRKQPFRYLYLTETRRPVQQGRFLHISKQNIRGLSEVSLQTGKVASLQEGLELCIHTRLTFAAKIRINRMPLIITLLLFTGGLYLVLSRPQGLWLLIGLELMLNAAAPLLLSAATSEAITLIFLLLLFALLEAAAALFILYHYARQKSTLNLHDVPGL